MAGMKEGAAVTADPATRWDAMPRLPRRNWVSAVLVMFAAGLNAFNDNVLKMVIIGLVPKVDSGSLSNNIGALLGGIILLPYILFAPLSGYWSDRFSKRGVIMAMLVAQAVILLMAGLALESALGHASVALAIITFFLLAFDTTVLSPAKTGIMKELVGSRRLGVMAGWLQMVTVVSMLAGIWVGGEWFDALFRRTGDAWHSAAHPVWVLLAVAAAAVAACWAIQPTPGHPQVAFRASLFWEHFDHLKETLRERSIRRACLGNSSYWFVATMTMAMVVDIGIALHPGKSSVGASSATAMMTLMLGAGTAAGAVFISWLNRTGLQIGVIPLGAAGMAAALVWCGFEEPGTRAFHAALAAVGFTGGCFMVPIFALIQDLAPAEKRGRVLSAANLMDSIAGIAAVLLMLGLKAAGFGFRWQFVFLGVLALGAAAYMVRIIPADLVRFVCTGIIRSIYRVRLHHAERLPVSGGVLVLPNHVSYMDAMVLGTSCPRPIRFVIWDVLYKVWWMRGFLQLFGTVPISPARAKEAVRSVAGALQEGGVVCVFPEGQITRMGIVNEIQRGFHLMARQGEAPVMPVYLDGLYGSVFSYQGGRFFKKWPKRLRYPVAVFYGECIPPKEANAGRVRCALLELGSEAFLARRQFETRHLPRLDQSACTEHERVQALANAMRLADIELLRKGDVLVTSFAKGSAQHRSLAFVPSVRDDVRFAGGDLGQTVSVGEKSVVGVAGDLAGVRSLLSWPDWPRSGRVILWWPLVQSGVPRDTGATPILAGLFDAATGALVAQNIPGPESLPRDGSAQPGTREGSQGRLLPGLAIRERDDGVEIRGLVPGDDASVFLLGHRFDEEGFLVAKE